MARYELVPALLAASLIGGAIPSLARHLEPMIGGRLGGGPRRTRLALAAFLLGLVVGLPFAGLAVDEWGAGWGLTGGPSLLALAFAALALEPRFAEVGNRFASHVVALGCLGIGTAWLTCAAVVLTPAGLWPEHPEAALGIAFTFAGFGALTAPALAKSLGDPGRAGRTLTLLALVCLVPACATVPTPADDWPSGREVDLDRALNDPAVGLTAAAMALCGLVGAGMDRRFAGRPADSAAPRIFGGALVGARFLALPLLAWLGFASDNAAWYAVGFGLAATVALGQLVGTPEATRLPGALGPLGFALGPVVPALAAALLSRSPEAPGVVVGVALAAGFLGEEALPPLVAWFRRATGLSDRGAPLGTGLVMLGVLLALALIQSKEDHRLPRPPLPFRLPAIHLPRLPHFHPFGGPGKKPSSPGER